MKAVVFHGVGDIRLETVRDPKLRAPTDAIVRLTASAIMNAIEAYKAFDRHEPGWIKVKLQPGD